MTIETSPATWYVATLKPAATRNAPNLSRTPEHHRGQSIVERSLAEAGFLCYLPRLRREIRHHRTKKMIVRPFPLFTGYAFVAAPNGDPRWPRLRSCDGIANILGLDGSPWAVPSGQVEAIRAAEANMTFDDTREARIRRKEEGRTRRETIKMRFPVGARVDVTKGPFAGFHGFVEGVTGKGIVKAAVEIFARLTPVEFTVDELRRH